MGRIDNQKTIDAWNQIAPFWDDYIGPDGNKFHRMLVAPPTEKLLDIQPGEQVLEVACGNGQFARRLADLGAQVTAIDASEVFIERACGHSAEYGDHITYHLLDATDEVALLELSEGRFDAAIANMALMDIPVIEPLAAALAKLLRPGGRFVWSVTHPCFNSVGSSMMAEQTDETGELVTVYSIKTSAYLQPNSRPGIGIAGQPVPHHYFHRPLHVLFNTFFQAGFTLDGIEEPAFPPGTDHHRPFSWSHFTDIPPALIVRMRLI